MKETLSDYLQSGPGAAAILIAVAVYLFLDAQGVIRPRWVRVVIPCALLLILFWIFDGLMGAMSV